MGWDRVRVLRRKKKVWAASLPSWRHLGCLDAILALDLWLLGTWGGIRASRECEFAGPQDLPGVTGPGAELTLRREGMGWGPAALLDFALWLRG